MSESYCTTGRVSALVKYFESLVQRELNIPRKSIQFKKTLPKTRVSRSRLSVSQPTSPSSNGMEIKKVEASSTLKMLVSPAVKKIRKQRGPKVKMISVNQKQKTESIDSNEVSVTLPISQTNDKLPSSSSSNTIAINESTTPTTSSFDTSSNSNSLSNSIPQMTFDSKESSQSSSLQPVPNEFETGTQSVMIDSSTMQKTGPSVVSTEHSIKSPKRKLPEGTPNKRNPHSELTTRVKQSPAKTPRRDAVGFKSPQRYRNSPRVSEPVRSPPKPHHSPRPSDAFLLSTVDTSRIYIAEEILRSEETYASLLDNLIKV